MAKILKVNLPVITKKTRRQTIIETLKEILKEVKQQQRPAQTFQYLIDVISQFEKFKHDKEVLEIIEEFNVWFESRKKGKP